MGSNPASPSSLGSGEAVPSEGVPEGWWGRWISQRAKESQKGSVPLRLVNGSEEDYPETRSASVSLQPQQPMNFRKGLLLLLVGVGVAYGESSETNKIVEIKTQILAFPKDTEISDKDLQDVLKQNADLPAMGISAVLMKEQTDSLLQSLKNQPNVDWSYIPVIKVSSTQTGTASNVLECKIPDTDETKIGITIIATPTVQKDTSIDLNLKVDWNRYFGYYSKNKGSKWTFNNKNPNAVAVIPSIRPTIPLIRHSATEIKTTIYDGYTAVYQYPVLDELKTTQGDQITLLLITVNLNTP